MPWAQCTYSFPKKITKRSRPHANYMDPEDGFQRNRDNESQPSRSNEAAFRTMQNFKPQTMTQVKKC